VVRPPQGPKKKLKILGFGPWGWPKPPLGSTEVASHLTFILFDFTFLLFDFNILLLLVF
jgi:hypothetical protein